MFFPGLPVSVPLFVYIVKADTANSFNFPSMHLWKCSFGLLNTLYSFNIFFFVIDLHHCFVCSKIHVPDQRSKLNEQN